MTRDEVKEFIADLIDDTLENINFQLSMNTELSFEEIDALIKEVWNEKNK